VHCPFSGTDVYTSIDHSIPVECPLCGATKKISGTQVWSNMFVYPSHYQPDGGRLRKRYKRQVNMLWKIVEGE